MSQLQVDRSAIEQPPAYRSRSIRDDEGRAWLVREAPLPAFERHAGLCLVFERPEVVRRIRVFPEHWLDLTDGDLYRLSEGV